MRVLFISEIVGKSGVFCVKKKLSELIKKYSIDIVIANADGATGGYGLGKNHAIYMRKLGIDVITGSNQIFYKQDMLEYIVKSRNILRPANLPPSTPGHGTCYYKLSDNRELLVISLLGQSQHKRIYPDNPFHSINRILHHTRTQNIIVDFHALMTSEKTAMGYYLKNRVSAVIGSGQRVQSADARIIDGTALITDIGRTGSIDSVWGWVPKNEITKYMYQQPVPSEISFSGLQIQTVVLEINETGKAIYFEPVNIAVQNQPEASSLESPQS